MITRKQPAVLAVDVGGSATKTGYATRDGRMHAIRSVSTRTLGANHGLVEGLSKFVGETARTAPESLEVIAASLVVPGIVDAQTGVGIMSTMLGWRDAPIRDLVQAECGLQVVLGHDVSAAALAEGEYGAGRGHRDWIFLALGTGLGSALVLGSKPYRGSNGWGGELSHFVVSADGPPCSCGKQGCLEMLASASALSSRYRSATGHDVSAAEITSLALRGEPHAVTVWDEAVGALVVALSALVESLNPSAIVVGGGLANAGDQLVLPLSEGVDQNVAFVQPTPVVCRAELGVYAGVYGAGLLGRPFLDGEVNT